MNQAAKAEFLTLLTKTMAAYGKPLPEAGILTAWIEEMTPFPMRVIELAIVAYRDQNAQFSPVPAAVAKICKTMDGRPSDEEAWAQSFPCISESETVVWTEEMRDAFFECRPLLEAFDNVGARMAFKSAYARLVADARNCGRPAKWVVSLGFDKDKQRVVLKKAEVAGYLPAPVVAGLLPNNTKVEDDLGECPEGLRRVKELMAVLEKKRSDDVVEHQRALEQERIDLQAKKAAIAEQVRQKLAAQ